MNTPINDLLSQPFLDVYGPADIVANMVVAFLFGMVISLVYRTTHKGLSYSQSFVLTVVFVTVIVAIVIMVIGNNLARAFALVGALSIIRFRTVVKDTKDTAYVFLALAAGMAAGTSNYFLGLAGVGFMSVVALVLHATNYGSLYKSEFILRFRAPTGTDEPAYSAIVAEFAKSSNLLHVEPSGDGETAKLSFDILMKRDADPRILTGRLAAVPGISEVVVVASKSDVDY